MVFAKVWVSGVFLLHLNSYLNIACVKLTDIKNRGKPLIEVYLVIVHFILSDIDNKEPSLKLGLFMINV